MATEGFDFQHLGIRKRLKVAAAIRVKRPGIIFEGLYEQAVAQHIGDPPLSVRQTKFDRRIVSGLPKQPELCSESQPQVGKIGVGPKDNAAVWQEVAGMFSEGRLRNDLESFRPHHRHRPRCEGDRLLTFIDDGMP